MLFNRVKLIDMLLIHGSDLIIDRDPNAKDLTLSYWVKLAAWVPKESRHQSYIHNIILILHSLKIPIQSKLTPIFSQL
jgi:hypothetical protein